MRARAGAQELPPLRPSAEALDGTARDGLAAIAAQLAELTVQVEKLRKAVKKMN